MNQYMQTYNRERRAELKRLGLCRDCKLPADGFLRCSACRFAHSIKNKNLRQCASTK